MLYYSSIDLFSSFNFVTNSTFYIFPGHPFELIECADVEAIFFVAAGVCIFVTNTLFVNYKSIVSDLIEWSNNNSLTCCRSKFVSRFSTPFFSTIVVWF